MAPLAVVKEMPPQLVSSVEPLLRTYLMFLPLLLFLLLQLMLFTWLWLEVDLLSRSLSLVGLPLAAD